MFFEIQLNFNNKAFYEIILVEIYVRFEQQSSNTLTR